MKYDNFFISIVVLLLVNPVNAGLINLENIGYVQYGDAQSYSLPIAQIQDNCTSPGCQYRVASTPGQIQDLIVVATGSSGTPVNTNFAGMDDAYSTPSGVSGSNFFSTGTVDDPNAEGEFFGDDALTWDATLLSLMGYLNGDDMVFMFNNNNLNGGNLQNLAAWMQITLTDDLGNVFSVYDLTNNNSSYNLVSLGGGGEFLGDVGDYTSDGSDPDGNTNSDTDYVLSGGPICVTLNTLTPIPVPCDDNNPNVSKPVNHNLGADEVAYAVLFPELNDELFDLFSSLENDVLDKYTLNIDLRLGCDGSLFNGIDTDEICSGVNHGFGKNINNGYEQLFISTATPTRQVPEPSTLILALTTLLFLLTVKKYQLTK